MLNPDFPLQILFADVKSQVFLLILAGFLKGGRCPQGGIESDIRVVTVGGTGLDVAPALLFGFCLGTSAGLFAIQVVQGAGDIVRFQAFPDPGLFSPFPPICVAGVKDVLLACFRRFQLLLGFPDPVR